MENYSSNSKRSKQERKGDAPVTSEKKVGKVIHGKAKIQKKSELSKIAGAFFVEDVSDVASFVVLDVVLPAIKRGFLESMGMILGVDVGGYYGRRNDNRSKDRVSYGKYYDRRDDRYDRRDDRDRDRDTRTNRSRAGYEYENVLLENKGDAEEVLDMMAELIKEYDWCTVADLYDMLEITPPSTGINYGWDSMDRMRPVRTYSGEYRLDLPRPILISDRR